MFSTIWVSAIAGNLAAKWPVLALVIVAAVAIFLVGNWLRYKLRIAAIYKSVHDNTARMKAADQAEWERQEAIYRVTDPLPPDLHRAFSELQNQNVESSLENEVRWARQGVIGVRNSKPFYVQIEIEITVSDQLYLCLHPKSGGAWFRSRSTRRLLEYVHRITTRYIPQER